MTALAGPHHPPRQSVTEGIPRIALTWLLCAQVLVIAPHLTHVPWWIVGLWLGCAGWRIQIFRMRAGYPGTLVKVLLMTGSVAGVLLSWGNLFGLEAGTVLLLAAFVLKLLEMKTPRDALVVIFLGFFAVVTAYLFDNDMLLALFSLLPVTALLAALIGLQQSALAEHPWATLRLAASLLLQALPLMLLLFVFFPRLGPLWSLPTPQDKAVTGLSDSLAPGEIATLSQSGDLAFRVSFDGPIPPRDTLYWRALTLGRFDGQRWTQSSGAQVPAEPAWQRQGTPLHYSVVMQASSRPWLFSLDVGETDLERTRMMSDFRLERFRPVDSPLLYQVTSWPEALRQVRLPPETRRAALQLPAQGDPRSRAWAGQLLREHPEPQALVQAVLRWFHDQPYRYTLHPPAVGENSIDGFLFDTRQGFCAHYAGAMVFVLRAAGIPARMVVGYQGGEPNPSGHYLAVHQFDAHAWVEYWREGQGWVSVDPTFQVAPERIESGLEAAVASERSFLEDSPFSALRYRDVGWLNQVRLAWDRINYGWERWVLGYQGEQQMQTLRRWFGEVDWRWIGIALVGVGGLSMGGLAVWLFKPWRREGDPQLRLFRRFEATLARHGLQRQPGEGARAFAERSALALPSQARAIRDFAERFEAARYASEAVEPVELAHLLARLRRGLRWRGRQNPRAKTSDAR